MSVKQPSHHSFELPFWVHHHGQGLCECLRHGHNIGHGHDVSHGVDHGHSLEHDHDHDLEFSLSILRFKSNSESLSHSL